MLKILNQVDCKHNDGGGHENNFLVIHLSNSVIDSQTIQQMYTHRIALTIHIGLLALDVFANHVY